MGDEGLINCDNKYVVYRHIFPNGKSYIGITGVQPYTSRWKDGRGYAKQPKMRFAIAKYGWMNVAHEVLFSNLSLSEAYSIEQEMIAKYDSIRNGYNTTQGGAGVLIAERSEEWGRNISLASRGKKCPWSAETLKKYMNSHGAWNKGKSLSESHYEHLKPHWQKMGKPITAYDPMTLRPVLHFESCASASKSVGVSDRNISRCAHGRRKTAAGYVWRFDNDCF